MDKFIHLPLHVVTPPLFKDIKTHKNSNARTQYIRNYLSVTKVLFWFVKLPYLAAIANNQETDINRIKLHLRLYSQSPHKKMLATNLWNIKHFYLNNQN